MSRRTRHSLPTSKQLIQPKVVENVPRLLKQKNQKSKTQYDEHAKDLSNLVIGQRIRMKSLPSEPNKKWQFGNVVEEAGKRSYIVGKHYRRNRRDLRTTHEKFYNNAEQDLISKLTDDLSDPPLLPTTSESHKMSEKSSEIQKKVQIPKLKVQLPTTSVSECAKSTCKIC
ncbi:hypothetical protein FSP39_024806 [Pinctada imbricata]|uniref:Uncharacterized protein n=1 Tax=Pinctada imbricata TaxID=66713 RepID=A0AA88XEJ4_PINIB|nr:hypothetical protein FSP39_024806 [Pinctada imbricata]